MVTTKTRSILKAISWRIVGTLDTMALGWIITGSPLVGLKIGALELVTKFILYYLHERAWLKNKYGIKK
jgi:adenylylsulfate kinase